MSSSTPLSLDRILTLRTTLTEITTQTSIFKNPSFIPSLLIIGISTCFGFYRMGRNDAAIVALTIMVGCIFVTWHKGKEIEAEGKRTMEQVDKLSPREKSFILGSSTTTTTNENILTNNTTGSGRGNRLITPRQIVSTLDLKWSPPGTTPLPLQISPTHNSTSTSTTTRRDSKGDATSPSPILMNAVATSGGGGGGGGGSGRSILNNTSRNRGDSGSSLPPPPTSTTPQPTNTNNNNNSNLPSIMLTPSDKTPGSSSSSSNRRLFSGSGTTTTTTSATTTTTATTGTTPGGTNTTTTTTPSSLSSRMFGEEYADSLDATTESYFEQWIGNLKSTIATHVLTTFLIPLDENAARLGQLQDPSSGTPVFTRHLLDYEWDPETRLLEVATSRAAQLLIHRENDQAVLETLIQKRRVLERYLVVKRRNDSQMFPKGYVLKRLRSLTENEFSNFSWAGGEGWRGKSWSSESLPTDAEIFFRVVCVWLDDLLRHDQSPEFSQQHVRDWNIDDAREIIAALKASSFTGFLNCSQITSKTIPWVSDGGGNSNSSSSSSTAATTITISSEWYSSPSMPIVPKSFKPQFNLVINGKIFQVKPGRENVLRCIIHFLWALRSLKASGLEPFTSKVFKNEGLPISPLVLKSSSNSSGGSGGNNTTSSSGNIVGNMSTASPRSVSFGLDAW
jgi:hypothetical protein